MSDEALRLAQRAYEAAPLDPDAAWDYRRACERAGVDVPLDLLLNAPLPAATLHVPEGVVSMSCGGGPRGFLALNEAREWVQPRGWPPLAPVAPGPLEVPERAWLQVSCAPGEAGESLSARLQAMLLAFGRERLRLTLAGPPLPSPLRPQPLRDVPPLESLLLDLNLHGTLTDATSLLQHVRFGRLSLSRASPGHLGPLPEVEWGLELECQVAGVDVQALALAAPRLRSLSLPRLRRPVDLSSLRALRRLERLTLSDVDLDGLTGGLLCGLRLERLRLYPDRVTGEGLLGLAEAPTLTHLSLSCGVMRFDRPKSWRHVARLHRLRELRAGPVPAVGVKGWERLQDLELLDLSCSPPERLHSVAWSFLPRLARLRTLLTDYTGVDDFTAQTVAECRSLRHLDLRHEYGLTDRGLERLATLPRLERLSVIDTGTTPDGRAALRARGVDVVP